MTLRGQGPKYPLFHAVHTLRQELQDEIAQSRFEALNTQEPEKGVDFQTDRKGIVELSESGDELAMTKETDQRLEDLGERVVELEDFDDEYLTWNISISHTGQKACIDGRLLKIALGLPRECERVSLTGLTRQHELNGRMAELLTYSANKRRFVVMCENKRQMLLNGCNLVKLDGQCVVDPYVIKDSVHVHGHVGVFANKDFREGEIIFDETPLMESNVLEISEQGGVGVIVQAYLGLSAEQQKAVHALHSGKIVKGVAHAVETASIDGQGTDVLKESRQEKETDKYEAIVLNLTDVPEDRIQVLSKDFSAPLSH